MVQVINIGCRLNQTEGEQLKHLPPALLGEEVESDNHICFINTCAVTREAVSTSWKMIRRQIKNSKLKFATAGQNSKLIVTGCLATLEREKMLATPGIDAVLTQEEKVSLLEKKLGDVGDPELDSGQGSAPACIPSRSRPVIKIQDGCANVCSFCVARIIRGSPKSVAPQIIIDEINRLTNLGYQEVVFTGLNLGCYGKDISYSLTQLIQSLPTNSYRVRLSSLEPDTITDELLDLWKIKRLCRHLHIPLQSGDDRILKMMRRKYSTDDYRQLIEKVISKIPGINIGTDVMVGFPEENETAFKNTLNLVEEMPFGYLHVFPYSSRPGTESAKLLDTVNIEKKKERVRILREIADKKKRLFRERFNQSVLEVLVEKNQNGLTDNYIHVIIPQHSDFHKGQLYKLTV